MRLQPTSRRARKKIGWYCVRFMWPRPSLAAETSLRNNSNIIECPSCKQENSVDRKHCVKCGEELHKISKDYSSSSFPTSIGSK